MTELIYCAGGNKRMADIAVKHGFTYGAQLPATVYHPVQFADQDWKKPDRAKYMIALKEHRPRMATVLDLERDDQLEEILSWAVEAMRYVQTVIIIPKSFGSIAKLPRFIRGKEVRLGYSVPTKFGATSVPVWEFGDWPVHLLGGSPQRQYALREYLNVVSADGNYSQKQANERCQFFAPVQIKNRADGSSAYLTDFVANGNFPYLREVAISARSWEGDIPYLAFNLSCINIQNLWRHGAVCTVRYGVEGDIEQIVAISRQWRSELGYVMRPALRESITRKTLFVAVHDTRVVGFVNSRTRRDGVNVIYEIAVHRDWIGHYVGSCLLQAVPTPTRLKCTVDNERANLFYEMSGFCFAGREAGKHRPLNVWERV